MGRGDNGTWGWTGSVRTVVPEGPLTAAPLSPRHSCRNRHVPELAASAGWRFLPHSFLIYPSNTHFSFKTFLTYLSSFVQPEQNAVASGAYKQ